MVFQFHGRYSNWGHSVSSGFPQASRAPPTFTPRPACQWASSWERSAHTKVESHRPFLPTPSSSPVLFILFLIPGPLSCSYHTSSFILYHFHSDNNLTWTSVIIKNTKKYDRVFDNHLEPRCGGGGQLSFDESSYQSGSGSICHRAVRDCTSRQKGPNMLRENLQALIKTAT